MSDRPVGSPLERVIHVENAIHRKFNGNMRLLPYLMLHEFEALLFTDPVALAAVIPDRGLAPKIVNVMNGLAPEEINETPTSAPSKRILEVIPAYRKTLHGPTAAKRIGLAELRRKCPHFDNWVTALEGLSG